MSDIKLVIGTVIDDTALKNFQQKKLSVQVPAILTLPEGYKEKIEAVKRASGEVVESSKNTTIQYRTQLGLVKEIYTANLKTGAYDVQKATYADKTLKIEREATAEYTKQNTIIEKTAKALATFKAKEGSYAPGEKLSKAQGIAGQMEALQTQIPTLAIGSPQRGEAVGKLNQLSEALRVAQIGMKQAGAEGQTFGQRMEQAFSRLGFYAITTQALYKALQQIKEGVQYIKDLNKEMTNTQIVTGMTKDEINDLAVGYNDMARSLGATTLQVAQGSLEWFRQGKTVEETAQLTKSSIMMSKLGNMDAAQSTEYLTSILNGFKLESSDTTEVIDKLVAVDNTAATSVSELATAMQRSSAMAQQSGVDFDHLVAYIGTVSSVSRKSAQTVGESFKTMFVRMTDIQTGALDEEGMSINAVEKALHKHNIELRDSAGEFRSMDNVIRDVAKTWDTLGTVEQNEIAKAIAGTRQREQFLILMNNYNNVSEDRVSVEKLLETQINATGLANDRYAIFLDNVDAAQNRSTAAWEALWKATIESDSIVWFYNMSAATLDLATKAGGLIPVVGALLTAFLLFKSTQILGFITSGFASFTSTIGGAFVQALLTGTITTQGFSMALAGLGTSALSLLNPVTVVIAAIAGLILIYNKYKDVQADIAAGEADINTKIDAKINKLKEHGATVEDVMTAYRKSMEATRGTGEEGSLMLGGAIKDIRVDIMQKYSSLIRDTSKNYDEYAKAMERVVKQAGAQVDAQGRIYTTMQTARGEVRTYIDGVTILSKTMYDNSTAARIWGDTLDDSDVKLAKLATTLEKNPQDAIPSWLGLSNTIRGVSDEFSKLDGLIQKSLEGSLSFEDVATLPAEYIDALKVENGQIKLNVDMLKEEELQIMRNAVAKTETAYNAGLASEAELQVMQMKLRVMEDDAAKTHSIFELTAWNYENLMWQIANQASAAGEKVFYDMQGNALNSSKAIFEFMSASDANFMSIVSQYAKVLGISVSQAMQMVQGYVNSVYNDAAAKINSLSAAMNMGISAGSAPYAMQWGTGKSAVLPMAGGTTPLPSIPSGNYGGINGGGKGGGGGGGGSSDKQAKEDARLKKIQDNIEKERKKAIDGLKTQLDLYKDIIDARKSILDTMADERKYQDDVKDKQADILKIQNELAALQFENTPEAKARRLELQAQLQDTQKALEDIQYDQSIEQQKAALDASYQAFADKMNNAIKLVQNIEATSVGDFTGQLSEILSGLSSGGASATPITGNTVATFHDGAERGIVGSGSKTGELFAKLMSGELVSNDNQMRNFMTRTLPSLMGSPVQSSSSGGMSFDKLFDLVVQGNLDSSVLPDIERISNKVVDRINASLLNRGIIRNTNLTKI